jgi:hypothetical protein
MFASFKTGIVVAPFAIGIQVFRYSGIQVFGIEKRCVFADVKIERLNT